MVTYAISAKVVGKVMWVKLRVALCGKSFSFIVKSVFAVT